MLLLAAHFAILTIQSNTAQFTDSCLCFFSLFCAFETVERQGCRKEDSGPPFGKPIDRYHCLAQTTNIANCSNIKDKVSTYSSLSCLSLTPVTFIIHLFFIPGSPRNYSVGQSESGKRLINRTSHKPTSRAHTSPWRELAVSETLMIGRS